MNTTALPISTASSQPVPIASGVSVLPDSVAYIEAIKIRWLTVILAVWWILGSAVPMTAIVDWQTIEVVDQLKGILSWVSFA